MKLGVTGHRPERLGGRSPEVRGELVHLAGYIIGEWRPERVVSGMAEGWDTACAIAAILSGVPLVAALPFAGQEARWSLEAQRLYFWLLERAAAVEVISPGGYSHRKMQLRNMAIVEGCDMLLACWDGDPEGGTAHCVQYAESRRRPVYNCYADLDLPVIPTLYSPENR